MTAISDFTLRDRRTLTLMAFVALVAGYGGSQLSHTLPFARSALDVSEGGMNWVFATTRIMSWLGLGFMVIADRRGRRLPFLVAFTLLPLANLATAFAANPIVFAIAQGFARIAVIAVAALAIVILAEELTPRVRALGIGIYALMGAAGSGIGLALLPIAENTEQSWRTLFALTGVGLLALPLLYRFLGESRAYVQYEHKVRFRTALRSGLGRHFWPFALISFFIAAFSAPATSFVMERMVDNLQWETGPARFLLMVFSGLGAVGVIVGGRMADAIGRKRTTIVAIIFGLIGGVGFYTLNSGWALAPAIFLATLGLGMITPSLAAHRSELFPTRVRATAAGWITNIAIGGSITGFVAGALIVDRVGLSTTITVLGAGLIVAMILVTRLPETRGMDLVRSARARPHASTQESQTSPASSQSGPTRSRPGPTPAPAPQQAPQP